MTYNHMDSSGSSSLHLTPPVSRVAPFIPHLSVVRGPVVRCQWSSGPWSMVSSAFRIRDRTLVPSYAFRIFSPDAPTSSLA